MFRSMILASYLFATGLVVASGAGCSDTTAYADQVASPSVSPQIAIGVSPAKVRAPYDVQIIRQNGETLPTYALKDRYYVQGNAGERYTIRVTNPTAHRIEAVVSVDGLDVVDGDAGDLRKRGYVVPAYGETRIEGFRTSTADVATFRFSSVNDSYAGKKGAARNVGVIAVALFEEQAPPEEQQVIVGGNDETRRPSNGKYDYTDDLDRAKGAPPMPTTTVPAKDSNDNGVARADKKEAPAAHRMRRPAADKAPTTASVDPRSAPPAPPSGGAVRRGNYDDDGEGGDVDTATAQRPSERPGLGTEFGESRYSAASYTRFVRAPGRPIAVAELRYNDGGGLEALGINVRPRPDAGEIMTRETADPFPGDPNHFSRAP